MITIDKQKLFFAKVRPDAIIPTKREEDGCKDIYANFTANFMTIAPHEIKLIPTGIASAFSKDYRASIRERGSTGTKGLAYRSGQIDSGYRGEWFVPMNNTTNKLIVIAKKEYIKNNKFLNECDYITTHPYSKAICQVAIEEVPKMDVMEADYEQLLEITSVRGTSSLGASGK